MQAWVNKEALRASLAEKRAVYYSRSRQSLWRKGETSGHTQRLLSVMTDCDKDSIIYRVEQQGSACHTGHRHCFFYEALDGEWRDTRGE